MSIINKLQSHRDYIYVIYLILCTCVLLYVLKRLSEMEEKITYVQSKQIEELQEDVSESYTDGKQKQNQSHGTERDDGKGIGMHINDDNKMYNHQSTQSSKPPQQIQFQRYVETISKLPQLRTTQLSSYSTIQKPKVVCKDGVCSIEKILDAKQVAKPPSPMAYPPKVNNSDELKVEEVSDHDESDDESDHHDSNEEDDLNEFKEEMSQLVAQA